MNNAETRLCAEIYVARGWPVFPVHGILENGACTCGDPECQPANRGKHPATSHGHLDAALLSSEEIDATWSDLFTRNIAIATGSPSGLAVIDIDPRNGGFESIGEFEEMFPEDDFSTYTVKTGGGGLHLYFWITDDDSISTMPSMLRGVDLKAEGGYVLAPPSLHASGEQYALLNDLPLLPLPPSVLEIIATGTRPAGLKHSPPGAVSAAGLTAERHREIMANPSSLGPGERDTFFTFAARDLRRADVSFEDATLILAGVFERMHNPENDYFSPDQMMWKLSRAFETIDPEPSKANREIAQRLADSVLKSDPNHWSTYTDTLPDEVCTFEDATADETTVEEEPLPPTDLVPVRPTIIAPDGYRFPEEIWEHWNCEVPVPWGANDDGIARLCEMQWGHKLLFDRDLEDWLLYDSESEVWRPQSFPEVCELMKVTVRSIERIIARTIEDPKEQEQMLKFANKSLNDSSIKAALRSLSSHPNVVIHHHELDRSGLILPVENGVIEPNFFGEEFADIPFRSHDPADFFTRHANLAYDPEARASFWDSRLEEWFPDPDVRDFVQRLIGYAVFGSGQEKVFVVALGAKDSGKSSFFNNLRDLLGDFAVAISPEAITKKRFKDPNHFDLHRIDGARLLVASETARGDRYDTELLKVLASGGEDALLVRDLYKPFREIRNKALLVIMTNHMPKNTQLDEALWSRLVVLPFEASFPVDDPHTLKVQQMKHFIWSERDGVLRWIVEGYTNYMALGLAPPKAAREATEKARKSDDWLSSYIEHRLVFTPGAKTPLGLVKMDYLDWCRTTEDKPHDLFTSLLAERFTRDRSTGGVWVYRDVALRYPQRALPEGYQP